MSGQDDPRRGKPSASAMDKIAHCPGSYALERAVGQLSSNDQAQKDGVLVHASMESGSEEELVTMTQKEIKRALDGMEARELANWKLFVENESTYRPSAAAPQICREVRLWVRSAELDEIASAQLDVYAIWGRYGLILDFKTGFKNPTPSEISWQSRTQTIALWHAYPELVHIRAGFAHKRLGGAVDLTEYDVHAMNRIEWELRHVVRGTEQPYAPRVPGYWCRYCNGRGYCRENMVYAALPVPARMEANELDVALAVGKMSPEELGYFFRRKSLVTSVFDAMEERLKAMAPAELAQAGYTLVPGNKKVEITDHALAYGRLKELLTLEERSQCIKLSREKAAEILADRTGMSKEKAAQSILEALGDIAVQGRGNNKLKPITWKPQLTALSGLKPQISNG